MAVIGTPVSEWEIGRFVFADEGRLLGRAASVGGLDAALDVAAGNGVSFPDIAVSGMDTELERWIHERARNHGEKWDFVIRDNHRKRWVRLRGAFLVRWGASPDCVWAINGAEPADGPF